MEMELRSSVQLHSKGLADIVVALAPLSFGGV